MAINYRVVEDNGGGLHLHVKIGRQVVFTHSGYEHHPESLLQDLDNLDAGDDTSTWEGNKGAEAAYWFDGRDGWEVVCSRGFGDGNKRKIYPARMGRAAQIAFGVTDEQRDAAWAAAQLGRVRSRAKAKASAENGKKGGRPRKTNN